MPRPDRKPAPVRPARQQTTPPPDMLPRLPEVERALAGALVMDARSEFVTPAAQLAPPEAFTDELARAVVEVVYRRTAGGHIADYATVVGELRTAGRFTAVDVTALLTDAGTPHYAEHYARQIAAVALRRQMIEASGAAAEWAYTGDDDIAGMAAAIQRLFEPLTPPSEENGCLADGIRRMLEGKRSRAATPTGVRVIDEAAGGIAAGDFVTVAGWTGLGKSHMAVTLANAAIDAGKMVLFVSLEMSREQVIDRLLFNRVGRWFPTAEGATYPAEVMNAAHMLSDPERIQVVTEARTVAAIAALVAREDPDVVIVDHAQILAPADPRASEYAAATANAAELMALAKRAPTRAVIVLSQLSREANRGHALGSRGFGMGTKGTNAWQENADLGVMLEGVWDDAIASSSHRAPDAIRVTIAKNRHGPSGGEVVYDQNGVTGRLTERRVDAERPAPRTWHDEVDA